MRKMKLVGNVKTLSSKELELGDVVISTVEENEKEGTTGVRFGYDTMTVRQIKDDNVTFFRPYVTTADFSYTGGVIPYIGIEEFRVPLSDHHRYILVDRLKTPLK